MIFWDAHTFQSGFFSTFSCKSVNDEKIKNIGIQASCWTHSRNDGVGVGSSVGNEFNFVDRSRMNV